MDTARHCSPTPPTFLLASAQPALLSHVEPTFLAARARVEVVLTAEAALAAVAKACAPRPSFTPPPETNLDSAPDPSLDPGFDPALDPILDPGYGRSFDRSFALNMETGLDLVLIDTNLPGMETGRLLAAIRAHAGQSTLPVLLIADSVTPEWLDRLAEGVIDDLILRGAEAAYWQIRVERALRAQRLAFELERLRGAAASHAQLDRLTGIYNRDAMLSLLFRETDRVQRMSGALCLILFDLDDFGHWNSRLGGDACDEILCQVAARTARMLRSYDLVGRMGKDEFLVALPGCAMANAEMLAERLRLEVFAAPIRVHGEAIRISACFGVASSHGRSPVVVLREAEQALERAKLTGPEAIQCYGAPAQTPPAPVTFLSETSGDELLAW